MLLITEQSLSPVIHCFPTGNPCRSNLIYLSQPSVWASVLLFWLYNQFMTRQRACAVLLLTLFIGLHKTKCKQHCRQRFQPYSLIVLIQIVSSFQPRSPRCFVTIKTKQKRCCRHGRKARPRSSKLSSSWTLSTPSWSSEEQSVGWKSSLWRTWRYCILGGISAWCHFKTIVVALYC